MSECPKNAPHGPSDGTKVSASDLVATLETLRGTQVLVFAPDEEEGIDDGAHCAVAKALRQISPGKPIDVIIHSLGGSPGAAYRIARQFQLAGGFTAVIPHKAKSAATLISLGAKLIIMNEGEGAELGPIDTQLPHPHEPEEMISALEGFKGLEAVSAFCQRFLDEAMILVLRRTGRSMKDSMELATNFAAPVVRPLFEQIDPMDLGRYKRALEIGVEYARRLLMATENYTEREVFKIVENLVYGYPAHGFAIDFEETKNMGLRAEKADAITASLAAAIVAALPSGHHVGFLAGGTPIAKLANVVSETSNGKTATPINASA